MLQKTKSKKGFMLSELLIVVAIIAVLTATAVPLFVGSLNRAKKETFYYNQKAIKSAGIAMLLSNGNVDFEKNKTFYAYAIVKDGKIDTVYVISSEKDYTDLKQQVGAAETYEEWAKGYDGNWKGGCLIIVKITVTDLEESIADSSSQNSVAHNHLSASGNLKVN